MKTAFLLLLLIPSPAVAQIAWPEAQRPIADHLSNWVVAANIGADTMRSWRRSDRKTAFACQAARVGSTLVLAELGKRVFHRTRPDGSDNKSFYSMHTALAMQASGWRVEAGVPIAVGAGYLRLAANKHYLTDVAVGALAGFVVREMAIGFDCP